MHYTFLITHSILRYVVLALLIVVIINSLLGLVNKKPFRSVDNKLSLYLFIATHTQLLIGIILFFVSPVVMFSGEAMKNDTTRYWLVEHNTAMIIAIVLITLARITSKKMSSDEAKHKRLFIFNLIALIIIVATVWMSGRGILGSSF